MGRLSICSVNVVCDAIQTATGEEFDKRLEDI